MKVFLTKLHNISETASTQQKKHKMRAKEVHKRKPYNLTREGKMKKIIAMMFIVVLSIVFTSTIAFSQSDFLPWKNQPNKALPILIAEGYEVVGTHFDRAGNKLGDAPVTDVEVIYLQKETNLYRCFSVFVKNPNEKPEILHGCDRVQPQQK